MKIIFFVYFGLTSVIVIVALILLFACLFFTKVSFNQSEHTEDCKPWRRPLSKTQFTRFAVVTIVVCLLRVLLYFLLAFFVNKSSDSFIDTYAVLFVILRLLLRSTGIGGFALCSLCLYTIGHNIKKTQRESLNED